MDNSDWMCVACLKKGDWLQPYLAHHKLTMNIINISRASNHRASACCKEGEELGSQQMHYVRAIQSDWC